MAGSTRKSKSIELQIAAELIKRQADRADLPFTDMMQAALLVAHSRSQAWKLCDGIESLGQIGQGPRSTTSVAAKLCFTEAVKLWCQPWIGVGRAIDDAGAMRDVEHERGTVHWQFDDIQLQPFIPAYLHALAVRVEVAPELLAWRGDIGHRRPGRTRFQGARIVFVLRAPRIANIHEVLAGHQPVDPAILLGLHGDLRAPGCSVARLCTQGTGVTR